MDDKNFAVLILQMALTCEKREKKYLMNITNHMVSSVGYHGNMHRVMAICVYQLCTYSGKLLREKTFMNFEV